MTHQVYLMHHPALTMYYPYIASCAVEYLNYWISVTFSPNLPQISETTIWQVINSTYSQEMIKL